MKKAIVFQLVQTYYISFKQERKEQKKIEYEK